MKKYIIVLLVAVSIGATPSKYEDDLVKSCGEAFSYFFAEVGYLPIPFPVLGVGIHLQKEKIGGDISLSSCSSSFLTAMKVSTAFLCFPFDRKDLKFYGGAGCAISLKFDRLNKDKCKISMFPQVILGRQYKNWEEKNRFIEIRIDIPKSKRVRRKKTNILCYPPVSVRYGREF